MSQRVDDSPTILPEAPSGKAAGGNSRIPLRVTGSGRRLDGLRAGCCSLATQPGRRARGSLVPDDALAGTCLHPAMIRTHSPAFTLSVISGKCGRNSTTPASSPPSSYARRIASAVASSTANMPTRLGRRRPKGRGAPQQPCELSPQGSQAGPHGHLGLSPLERRHALGPPSTGSRSLHASVQWAGQGGCEPRRSTCVCGFAPVEPLQ